MAWSLRFASVVLHEMKRLDRSDARFIADSLERFAANYDASFEAGLLKTGKLKQLKGGWEGFFRLRLRTYRVIYKKYEAALVVFVLRISHRRDAYRE